jgi:hypothetical protein
MLSGDAANAKEAAKDGLSIFPSDPNLQAIQRKLEDHP